MIVGFPEFWTQAHCRFGPFLDSVSELAVVWNDMMKVPVGGQLLFIAGRLVGAVMNSCGALTTLALNGFGLDAMKIARGMYEIEVNLFWLKDHPDELADFVDYRFIQRKQIYDQMSEEQRQQVPIDEYNQMIADYQRVLPRFPRKDWCRVSIYTRAQELEQDWNRKWKAQGTTGATFSLYETFYRYSCSLHHMDIMGILSSIDPNGQVITAPSFDHLEDAFVATACAHRCVEMYNEMAGLKMEERIRSGPHQTYSAACGTLSQARDRRGFRNK